MRTKKETLVDDSEVIEPEVISEPDTKKDAKEPAKKSNTTEIVLLVLLLVALIGTYIWLNHRKNKDENAD